MIGNTIAHVEYLSKKFVFFMTMGIFSFMNSEIVSKNNTIQVETLHLLWLFVCFIISEYNLFIKYIQAFFISFVEVQEFSKGVNIIFLKRNKTGGLI